MYIVLDVMDKKKTLIIGATPNPARYAYLAAHRLVDAGHKIVNIGIKKGEVAGVAIQPAGDPLPDIHSITLYIGPQTQPLYYDYIIHTKPQRLIFNPGTENPELEARAQAAGIDTIQACTLVLLSTNQY